MNHMKIINDLMNDNKKVILIIRGQSTVKQSIYT